VYNTCVGSPVPTGREAEKTDQGDWSRGNVLDDLKSGGPGKKYRPEWGPARWGSLAFFTNKPNGVSRAHLWVGDRVALWRKAGKGKIRHITGWQVIV